jgi:type IV pilus assembly protein PilC
VSSSIRTAASACGNAAIEGVIAKTISNVDAGAPLSQALDRTGIFPPTAIQLIATGEESGETVKLLYKTADYLDDQLEESAKRLFIILPIIMYAIMGSYIGYIFITKFLELTKLFLAP